MCGPFFVAGDTGDSICSLSDGQLAGYAERFAQPDEDITPEEIESHAGLSDSELMETQTANYFSNLYPIDCAVLSVNA